MSLKRIDSRDHLAFVVEVTKLEEKIKKDLQKKLLELTLIEKNIRAERMTRPEIELVGLGEIKRKGRAKKMIVDARE